MQMVQEWTRSRLLEKAQEDRILPELKTGLRRTNVFLRLALFGFGLLIIASSVLLAVVTLNPIDDEPIAVLCFFGAAISYGLAEYLVARFRVYRFGIEEAAAVAAGILLAFAVGFFASSLPLPRPGETAALASLIAGAIAAFWVYVRFGYIYAAIASLLCMSLAPFQTGLSPVTQRLASVLFLTVVFIVTRGKRRDSRDEFRSYEYSILQSVAWLGIYAFFNLHVESVLSIPRPPEFSGWFYWFSYAAVWAIPPLGLFLALRERERPLLDVSIVLALVTLATNKSYLGAVRQTWDPILLGVLLITTAVALRRWLSTTDRGGFTAARILESDKRGISTVGTASAALHGAAHMPVEATSPRTLEPGGGRSGGAGATGSF